jgi:hypothetical protein
MRPTASTAAFSAGTLLAVTHLPYRAPRAAQRLRNLPEAAAFGQPPLDLLVSIHRELPPRHLALPFVLAHNGTGLANPFRAARAGGPNPRKSGGYNLRKSGGTQPRKSPGPNQRKIWISGLPPAKANRGRGCRTRWNPGRSSPLSAQASSSIAGRTGDLICDAVLNDWLRCGAGIVEIGVSLVRIVVIIVLAQGTVQSV